MFEGHYHFSFSLDVLQKGGDQDKEVGGVEKPKSDIDLIYMYA